MFKIYKNFLEHKQAWDLACSIDGTPPHWWAHVIKHKDLEKPLYTYDNVGGNRHRFLLDSKLYSSLQKDSFTYKFHRTTKHGQACKCWECTFRDEVLLSDSFKDLLKKETNLKNPELLEYFTSAYHPGDFLGQHTDHQRGVAFIFHLSWDWKAEYGGLFHLETETGFDAYVPGWGDLVLMELGDTGQNHFVSEVSRLSPRPRLAISGWFNENS